MPSPRPFKVHFPDSDLSELHARLDNARWPRVDTVPDDLTPEEREQQYGMGYGIPLDRMKELAAGWRGFDWRAEERKINEFEHFKLEIEGLDTHFIHARSSRKDAIPLVMVHGWPGSFLEFLPIIPLLTSPPTPSDPAFHVVVPSQPGFAFSSPPTTSKWTMDDTARIFDKLMQELGYDDGYVAQGGDWGSITARCLGSLFPERCKATHINFCPVTPPAILSLVSPRTLLAWLPSWAMSEQKRQRTEKALQFVEKGSSYYAMQKLTPRTPAYALIDSPVGLLAWIGEKMLPSIDIAVTRPHPSLTVSDLYATLTLYHLTSTIGTSFLPYALNQQFTDFTTGPKYHLANFALSTFPREIVISPIEWVAKTGSLKWHKEADDGGHFAALEKPEVLAEHVREAVGVMWEGQKA